MAKTAKDKRADSLAQVLDIDAAIMTGLRAAQRFPKEADQALCIESALRQAGYKIVRARTAVRPDQTLRATVNRLDREAKTIPTYCEHCGGQLRPADRLDGPAKAGECSCWQTPR